MGFPSTLAYVAAASKAVLQETGLLPHVNAGVMSIEDIRQLQLVAVGQGLMLESSSARLLEPGGPHHDCPDKARRKSILLPTLQVYMSRQLQFCLHTHHHDLLGNVQCNQEMERC